VARVFQQTARDFKDVNDTLGHAMGDLLLKEVVSRLRSAVRSEDLVARFGGDEFAVFVPNVTDRATVGDLAARIGKLLAAPFNIKGHKLRITSSIGIALYSSEVAGPEAMMMRAVSRSTARRTTAATAIASTARTSTARCMNGCALPKSSERRWS
jgi:diguanylate cyclase (GGDEF)-like protein